MPFKWWKDENEVVGLRSGPTGPQAGVSDADLAINPEANYLFPYIVQKEESWILYNNSIICELDAGMTLHKPLPQSATPVDTLASGAIDDVDFAGTDAGVNLVSGGNYTDIVQRMATSTYIFKMRGRALRVGYKVPIPGLKLVAGVVPIPAERQIGYNTLVGNFGGIPLFRARWDLWYYVTLPPKQNQTPPDNLAAVISGAQQLPQGGIAVPYSFPDWNAVSTIKGVANNPGAGIQQVRQGG